MNYYPAFNQPVLRRLLESKQYTSLAFGGRCKEMGVRPSMDSVGDAYDNAMAESFFATLECELIARRTWKSKAEAKTAVFAWIQGWYNPRRRHSALGHQSPSTSKGAANSKNLPIYHRAANTGCPPRRSVRRKRRPPPWTTLQRWQPALENQVNNRPWKRGKSNRLRSASVCLAVVGLTFRRSRPPDGGG